VFSPGRRGPRHTAHIGKSHRIYYPYHPLCGHDVEILGYCAGKQGNQVLIRLPDDTKCGVPEWMFDEAVCAAMRTAEQPLIASRALLKLAVLLDSQQQVVRSAAHEPITDVSPTGGSSQTEPSTTPASGRSDPSGAHSILDPPQVPKPAGGVNPRGHNGRW